MEQNSRNYLQLFSDVTRLLTRKYLTTCLSITNTEYQLIISVHLQTCEYLLY